jgi:hypothetical protein
MHASYDLDFWIIGKFYNAKVMGEAQTILLFSKSRRFPDRQKAVG